MFSIWENSNINPDEIDFETPLRSKFPDTNYDYRDLEIAIIKWEIHHGYELCFNDCIDMSIEEIINYSLSNGRLNTTNYERLIDIRLNRLTDIFFNTEPLKNFIDKDFYTKNLN